MQEAELKQALEYDQAQKESIRKLRSELHGFSDLSQSSKSNLDIQKAVAPKVFEYLKLRLNKALRSECAAVYAELGLEPGINIMEQADKMLFNEEDKVDGKSEDPCINTEIQEYNAFRKLTGSLRESVHKTLEIYNTKLENNEDGAYLLDCILKLLDSVGRADNLADKSFVRKFS